MGHIFSLIHIQIYLNYCTLYTFLPTKPTVILSVGQSLSAVAAAAAPAYAYYRGNFLIFQISHPSKMRKHGKSFKAFHSMSEIHFVKLNFCKNLY